ncbi:hypothetical protein [Halarcobacter sp.]|uniref:hypothetical protein n=1 Tax=Halarcobacter sp. TaxID=2321133 RepID=UPI003AFFF25B
MKTEYTLPSETLPSLDMQSHFDDIECFIEFLNKRKIKTKNTRIERYLSYLKEVIDNNSKIIEINDIKKIFPLSHDNRFRTPLDYHMYVLREIHELMWIYNGIKDNVPKGIDEKLKFIIGGKDFAALDSSTNSRNTQFELRIASYFCKYDCLVDLSTETDIIAHTKKQSFYIECKRVGNIKKLSERISEARNQLKSRMPKKIFGKDIYGCIAIDITKIAFAHNGLTFAKTNEHSKDIIQNKLLTTFSMIENKVSENFDKNKNLCSVWLQIHIPSLITYPANTITRFSSYHYNRGDLNGKQKRAFTIFKELFESASDEIDERVIKPKKLEFQNKLVIPKGTIYSLNMELFEEFLLKDDITSIKNSDIVGSININNKLDEFNLLELLETLNSLTKKELKEYKDNIIFARLKILMDMYVKRYPYKEIQS